MEFDRFDLRGGVSQCSDFIDLVPSTVEYSIYVYTPYPAAH
jgi:hypothetical protein